MAGHSACPCTSRISKARHLSQTVHATKFKCVLCLMMLTLSPVLLQLSSKGCVTGLATSDAMSLFPTIEFTFAGSATGEASSWVLP